ncbi:Putative membrane-bound O-acyltransferase C24H6.01c [Serendipita indica DSM 11827]|nr:Putative membrane-bound O-acyltransferase C24H6.01c [Serendipita indica DSM 11827]
MSDSPNGMRERDARPAALNLSEDSKKFSLVSLTVQTPTSQQAPGTITRTPPPARWNTPEFIIYGVLFVIVFPMMVYSPMQLSLESHPNYHLFKHKLSKGWIPGRLVDNSDSQYRSIRGNLLNLTLLALAHLGLSRLYGLLASSFGSRATGKKSDNLHRIPFMAMFAVALVIGLHGASSLKVFAIIGGNYFLAKQLGGSRIAPLILWTVNIMVLLCNEIYDGYSFSSVHSSLGFLDGYRGFYPRWHISFNITMLRLLSFAMDYHWAKTNSTSHSPVPLNIRQRTSTSHHLANYNFVNYVAYTLYPPLYIAGPIMTFNDFYWQASFL